jgi:hypothetical protein
MLRAVPKFQICGKISFQKSFYAFWGLFLVSVILGTRNEPIANLQITNAVYARTVFRTTLARDRYFQVLSVIRFNDKTTRNLQWSPEKLGVNAQSQNQESMESNYELWQLYPYVTSGLGLRKNPPLIYCATECTNGLSWVSYVPARNKNVILPS